MSVCASVRRRRVLLAALLFLVAACGGFPFGLKPLDVTLVNIEPGEISLFEQRMRIEVRVKNPNNRPVSAAGMRLVLEVNGMEFVKAMGNAPFTVPRLGEARITVSGSTTTMLVLRHLMSMNAREPVKYRLAGDVFLESGFPSKVSFSSEGKIPLGKILGEGN